ncbi:MAG: SCO family protein [Alphaproteobacteria bacterium]|nr:SCO family protein [Alphaproteobacteria bacterium]
MGRRIVTAAMLGLTVLALGLQAKQAGAVTNPYTRPVESVVDSEIFRIDEKAFLGVRPNPETAFTDLDGQRLTLKQLQGKPVVVVLSYFQCDGTCSVINDDLKKLVKNGKLMRLGRDYEIVTASFNKEDTADNLNAFAQTLDLPKDMREGWHLARFETAESIQTFTESLGFKFFWSARDRVFLHPGVYVVLTPEGRVSRFLYAQTSEAADFDLALVEAGSNKISPARVLTYAVGLCYSYNYKEGRYTLNLPILIGAASMVFGLTTLAVAALYYRRRHLREGAVS